MGFWEIIIIAIVAICVFNPKQLPKLAKQFVKFRRAGLSFSERAQRAIDKELKQQQLQDNIARAKAAEDD